MSAALGLDIGTTNIKAVLVASDGTTQARAQQPLQTTRHGVSAEQDAAELWDRVADAVTELSTGHPDLAADVVTIGVCSQYSSIVPVDARAVPTGSMVMWSDQRGTDRSWAIMERDENAFATWIDKHGIPPIGSGLALAHLLHIQHDRPEIHGATAAYLEPMDYVTARLTGRITATQHSMFMSQLIDNRTLDANGYDDELVSLAGVDPTRLPSLIGIDDEVGALDATVADRLGLPRTATVFAGSNDTATLGLAAGVSRRGRGGLAIGTTSVLLDSVDVKRTDLDHEIVSMPGLVPDRYLTFAENGFGGRVVEYMLREIVFASDALGDHVTEQLFARLDDALGSTDAGAGGALFLPWLGGSLAPSADPNMRGGFINVSLETRRVDLVRAVTEGVAHNLAWLLPYVEEFTGHPIDELVFVGGAARSRVWCQILADVLGRPVLRTPEPDITVARTAARLALSRRGLLDRAELEAGAEVSARFEPQPGHRSLYELHQQQFEAAFEALAPISAALNADPGDET